MDDNTSGFFTTLSRNDTRSNDTNDDITVKKMNCEYGNNL
jgi:hypothetical protein